MQIQAVVRDETVWLTQRAMSELFEVRIPTINEHLTHIFQDNELEEKRTIRKFRIVQTEGTRQVEREVSFYNLDAIIAVGYRVNSKRATQFRIWATSILKEYLVKGFVLDDERFKKGQSLTHFRELLERIRAIRISERVFYQQIKEIYKLSDETTMKIYDDHIWLWNAGELPEGYNTETLQHDHRSLPHNKLIANVFYKAGFIEHWGRGFDKVKSAFLAADIPFPKVENEFWGVSVIIQRKAEQERPDIDIPDVVDFDITDRQRQILELIAKNPSITAAELAKILKVNSRTIQRDFAKLFEKGILIREGSDKSGERNIKMS